jgi:hypothetical protein
MRTFAWRSALRPAFVAASVAWAAVLLLAPFVASRPHASDAGAAFMITVYGIGSLLCHQLPERSFRVSSAQMPVCARCAGIYFGAAMAAIVASASGGMRAKSQHTPLVVSVSHHDQKRSSFDRLRTNGIGNHQFLTRHPISVANGPRAALIAAVIPTLATLVYEWTTGHMPAHWIRAAAGIPIGAVAAWLVVRHARDGRSAASERVEG